MTEENQERNARAELEKAQRCLREARVLLDAELPEGATRIP